MQGLITDKHLDNAAKVMMATGLIVGYSYIMEMFAAWYAGNTYEMAAFQHRMSGPYRHYYWILLACNVVAPNALWFKGIRRNPVVLFVWSLIVLVGMWLERFVIIVSSLAQDNLPGVLAPVPPHPLGRVYLRRHHRAVHLPLLPVHPHAAHDFDL